MYAITGITGKVGGALARTLLAADQSVRAVVRDAGKGRSWAEKGCELALAEMEDAAALTAAFKDVDGVFILPPSEFDPAPGFPEARAVLTAVKTVLQATGPRKVVSLSTVGAQATQPNLLTQRTLMEQELRELRIPVTSSGKVGSWKTLHGMSLRRATAASLRAFSNRSTSLFR